MFPDLSMNVWWQYAICVVLFAIGVFFLVKGSDLLVNGASSLAKKFKISTMIIGLTVVAFGTSCPELAVSTSDSINCLIDGTNAEIAIGNVVGSNICNVLVVLGISALFTPIIIKKESLKKEIPIFFGVTVLLVIFGLFFSARDDAYQIMRWEGIIFIVLIIAYVAFLVIDAKRNIKLGKIDESLEEVTEYSLPRSIIYTILGLIVVIAGGEATVYASKNIAIGIGTSAGLDNNLVTSLVGLTVVAVGTSLPELVTSAVAAKKGQNDLALGNVIGSNIFNILFILGIASVINPLSSGSQLPIDLFVMLGAAIVLCIFAFIGKIKRWGGILFLVLYGGYLAYLITRTLTSSAI